MSPVKAPPRPLTAEELRPSRRRAAAQAALGGRAGGGGAPRPGSGPKHRAQGPVRRTPRRTLFTPPAARARRRSEGRVGGPRRVARAAGVGAAGAAHLAGAAGTLGAHAATTVVRRTVLPTPLERDRRRSEREASAPTIDPTKVGTRRLIGLLVAIAVVCIALVGRLVDLQVLSAKPLAARAERQLVSTDRLPADRGSIFDRNGRELAMSVPAPTVYADPTKVVDAAAAAIALEPVLGIPVTDLQERLQRAGKFVYLARRIPQDAAERVKALAVPGVYLLDEPQRHLPAGGLASSVVGRVGVDNEGLSGLEYQFEKDLAGTPGKLVAERDQQGREIPGGVRQYDASSRGNDLVLTIDRSLQFQTERDLGAEITAAHAKGGIAVVMDTKTGELLAVASLEADPKGGAPVPAEKDQAVTNVYEPGSVNKLITVAGAIEEKAVAAGDKLTVPSTIKVGDHVYSEHDPHPTQQWSVTDIVANSSNVGSIMIAKQLGKQRFDHYLRAFGFGKKTGLGDPGEAAGILKDPKDYDGTSMGSFPIGQGIAVTAVQMVAAYNTVANGGMYVPPKLVKATVGEDGKQTPVASPAPHRVISEQTAADMTVMLGEVVRVGTGTLAAIDGYTVAGKTGTARKPAEGRRGYEDGAYVSSFAGFVPAEAPALTAMVILDQPSPIFGGIVAAPVFSSIGGYALRELRIPPPAARLRPSSALLSTEEASKSVGEVGDAQVPATIVPLPLGGPTTSGPTGPGLTGPSTGPSSAPSTAPSTTAATGPTTPTTRRRSTATTTPTTTRRSSTTSTTTPASTSRNSTPSTVARRSPPTTGG